MTPYTPYEPVAVDFICAGIVLLVLFALLLLLGSWLETRLALQALSHTAPEPQPETPMAAQLPPFTGTDFGFLEDPHTIAARRAFLESAARLSGTAR